MLKERSLAKSIIVQKVFKPATRDIQLIEQWCSTLCHECLQRVDGFVTDHAVRPHALNIKYGGQAFRSVGDLVNTTVPFPWPCDRSVMVARCVEVANVLFKADAVAAVNNILLTACNLQPIGANDVHDKRQPTLSQLQRRRRKRAREEHVVVDVDDDEDNDDVVVLSARIQSVASSQVNSVQCCSPPVKDLADRGSSDRSIFVPDD